MSRPKAIYKLDGVEYSEDDLIHAFENREPPWKAPLGIHDTHPDHMTQGEFFQQMTPIERVGYHSVTLRFCEQKQPELPSTLAKELQKKWLETENRVYRDALYQEITEAHGNGTKGELMVKQALAQGCDQQRAREELTFAIVIAIVSLCRDGTASNPTQAINVVALTSGLERGSVRSAETQIQYVRRAWETRPEGIRLNRSEDIKRTD